MTFEQYHKIGESVAPHLDKKESYSKIGKELGLTKQRTWHIAMVALGKVAHGLKEVYK